jgi:hypothetical protein
MPLYDYICPANGTQIEVEHSMKTAVRTWGELCERAGLDLGDTPPDSPVEKRINIAPGINTPTGDSQLKNQGFTKLVRRDKGVYENVTATGGESRYMNADDASTMPHLNKKIRD